MSVYVDDMRAPFGRLIMCHMIADSDEELHAMAATIGVARKWHQAPPKSSISHYDICLSKRALAVAAGAEQIGMKELACYGLALRRGIKVDSPAHALALRRKAITEKQEQANG